jgi:uncharacterized phage protein gp47/JayE
MASQSDIVQQMLAALLVAEPSLDTSIGSPVRSILDVVSEQIAEAYADQYLLNYGTNVYTKSGSDLDNYVAQYGFTRLPGVRASGSITFSRTSVASADVYIGAGTQVTDSATPPNIFNTLTPVILAANTTSCSVPIQAQIAGTSGNVAANTIVNVTTLSMGFSSLTNPSGLSGGTNPESDDQLRARFIATVFRALTGTAQMFEAVGLEDPDVSQCNVIGATKTFIETINIVDGFALSSVTDFFYLYPNTSVLGPDIANGQIDTPGADYTLTTELITGDSLSLGVTNNSTGGSYSDIGPVGYGLVVNTSTGSSAVSTEVDASTSVGSLNSFSLSWTNTWAVGDINPIETIDIYVNLGSGLQYLKTVPGSQTAYLDTGSITPGGSPPETNNAYSPPSVGVLNDTVIPDGIYDLQYDYLPSTSRNDPAKGVTNRIDVYVNGDRPIEVTQDAQWTDGFPFDRNAGSGFEITQFQRLDGSNPEPGNYFIPFAYSPIINAALSGTIIVGGYTYNENTDFWTVNDITPFGLGPLSRAGVEWRSSANGASSVPTNGQAMNLDYSFNQIPQSVQTGIQNWRLVGTDVQVHQAKILNLNFYLGLILTSASYSQPTILAQIQTAISNYLSSLTFNSVVQVSEVLALVQGLPGVVAVRFLNSGDDTSTTYPVNSQWASGDYAIQSVNDVNAVLHTYADASSPSRAVDVFLDDDTLASLANVYLKFYANNSFGAV